MIGSRINSCLDTLAKYQISESNPVFFGRITFYLAILRRSHETFLEKNNDDIQHALLETQTIIQMDDDLDYRGVEYLMELWEKALDIQYGRDYEYHMTKNGSIVLHCL